ncbi:MAG: hypothetical protein EON92_17600, partial [Burkholderiales bacterium]
ETGVPPDRQAAGRPHRGRDECRRRFLLLHAQREQAPGGPPAAAGDGGRRHPGRCEGRLRHAGPGDGHHADIGAGDPFLRDGQAAHDRDRREVARPLLRRAA